jgi:hypothetical protein
VRRHASSFKARALGHVGCEELDEVASRALRLVHRGVSVLHQGLYVLAVVRKNRHTDTTRHRQRDAA